MIRVVIVDDHVAIRKMLEVFLERETGYEVVGETASGLEAIRLCADLRPDLVILDLMLMELSGPEAMKPIREQSPATRILVYTGTQNLDLIHRCLEAKPDGFVEKFADINLLREALKDVSAGRKFFTALATTLLNNPDDWKPDLTARERKILQLIAEGKIQKKNTLHPGMFKSEIERLNLMALKKSPTKIAAPPDSKTGEIPTTEPQSIPLSERRNPPQFSKRAIKMILIAIVAFVCILFFNQHRLIWLPRHYSPDEEANLPKTAVILDYTTSQGTQRAYYISPSAPGVTNPARIWILFCGNGSLALDWLDFLLMAPDKNDGFLLFDYPGYGRCEGSATPATIKESSEAAFDKLCDHLGYSQPKTIKVNILAHSIGCAAGLEFATRHPVGEIVLAAPFTSLRDMARRTVGWPLCWLLRHNFDNRARLAELAARTSPPRVTIFHGSDDTLIPPKMGRSLADSFPKMITFHEVPNAGHNTIVEIAQPQIFAVIKD